MANTTVVIPADLQRIENALAYIRQHDDGGAKAYDAQAGLMAVLAWLQHALEVR